MTSLELFGCRQEGFKKLQASPSNGILDQSLRHSGRGAQHPLKAFHECM